MILGAALIVMLVSTLGGGALAQSLEQKKTDAQSQVGKLQQRMEDAVERYNYACSKLEQTRAAISENKVKLTAAEKERFAHGTAERLLGLDHAPDR